MTRASQLGSQVVKTDLRHLMLVPSLFHRKAQFAG
jgi:hypothetical protein